MFPYRVSKNHDRLPVGLNIHGKSHFEIPNSFLDDESDSGENGIRINIDPKTFFSDEGSLSEIKQTCNYPTSTFEMACLLHNAKSFSIRRENSGSEADTMAANILSVCGYVERMAESKTYHSSLQIAQKNTMPLPSRLAFMPHKNDVRVGSMLRFSSVANNSSPSPMALDLLGGGHDIVDTGAEMSDFETTMSRFCGTVWYSNNAEGDSIDDGERGTFDMESVSIDIEDRVMLDKLKGLWKNRAGEEAYIQSIQDKKKRKRRNARHSLGQFMEL